MGTCLVCDTSVKIGTLCRQHSLALATCDNITAEQIVSLAEVEPAAWLIDQWGCTHPLVSPCVIGRAMTDCNLAVMHPSVSVLHAELQSDIGGWRIADRGSLNGTHLNGERIRSAQLMSGDVLRIGDVSFFFSAGSLPAINESASTGRTLPSARDEIALETSLRRESRTIEILQRPGGGIIREGGETVLELAQLEFGLLAQLVGARIRADDPALSFVSSRALADELEFKSHQADSENVRELVRRVRKKAAAAGIEDLIESQQRVGYRLGWEIN